MKSLGLRSEQVGPPLDEIRVGVERHLAICEAVRDGIMDIGFIGVDKKTGIAQATVTLEDVDQTEAIIRDFFGTQFPYLIGRDPQTPPTQL